ncbi:MAG TPA: hypothetical protein VMX54_11240 [Vicinamibacteria bacterium]|nr:hypothetical protein [Vicinamibacteria bacterium]
MSWRWLLGRMVLLAVLVFLAVGGIASWRALVPVSRLQVQVPGGVLRPGREVWIETVSSGRGPVQLRLEALQGGRSELLASGHVASRRWAFWDPRSVRHSMVVSVRPQTIAHLVAGPVTLRATAIGAPAWLHRPAPVVRQIEVACQP